MLHFTNQELAETYHVSVRTVRNWIDAARDGKLDLVLHTQGKRSYVANTSRNVATMKQLSEKNKKFRPLRSVKMVAPKPEFYKLYNQAQIYDIVANMEIHHEIPRQYNYFDQGALYWDSYANRLAEEETPNNLTACVQLLESNQKYIDDLLSLYKQVNVIDIGLGNALPTKKFLEHLLNQDKLGRYIGIDISPTMLSIAERNIESWFGDKIKFEGHALDFENERFGILLADEYIKSNSQDTCNILLFLGGTLQNFRKPEAVLSVLHDSMGVNDFLIHEQKLDTKTSRRYFDFNPVPSNTTLAPNHRLIFDLFNIDESIYDVEMGFDSELSERYIRVALKVALNITFAFQTGERTIRFNKGDTLLLWRARQNKLLDLLQLFEKSDLYPLHISQTIDQEFILTMSRIRQT
ncbi:MAG TPA: L-histidine N(alpha)-methyltransferase [Candidatus Limnocylindrales bacterium]|nr:L-histidine N(alpha)-methyltransferase [Candidatus Limnocylindrales bacterium]